MGRLKGEDVSGLHTELTQKFRELNEVCSPISLCALIIKKLSFGTATIAQPIFQHLAKKKTKFFGGDSVNMTDYMIWPWFERLEPFELKE